MTGEEGGTVAEYSRVELALILVLVAFYWYERSISDRLASAAPDGQKPRLQGGGVLWVGVALWIGARWLPDPALSAIVRYGGWACLLGAHVWWVLQLKRLDRPAERNLD